MNDPLQPTSEAGFAATMRAIGNRKSWFAVAVAAALLIATVYLRTATYSYTVDMTVVPAQSSSAPSGGGLAGVAQMAGISLGSGGEVDPLDLYVEQIYSRKVAERIAGSGELMRELFSAEWNPQTGRWQEPESSTRAFVNGIKRLLGVPVREWRPPDAARLQAFIRGAVRVTEADTKPIVQIAMDHPDPTFARKLLLSLHRATDSVLRRTAMSKASEHIAYLSATLPTVRIAEQRAALASMLSEQEKTRMLGSSSTYYAAELLDGPNASDGPTRPRALFVIIGAVLVGVAVALAAILLRLQFVRSTDEP